MYSVHIVEVEWRNLTEQYQYCAACPCSCYCWQPTHTYGPFNAIHKVNFLSIQDDMQEKKISKLDALILFIIMCTHMEETRLAYNNIVYVRSFTWDRWIHTKSETDTQQTKNLTQTRMCHCGGGAALTPLPPLSPQTHTHKISTQT